MKKRILSLLLVCCMLLTLMPTIAHAATNYLDISTGNIVISAGGDYEITGSTTTYTITVNPSVTGVNITLNNVSVDVSAIDNACAFDIGDGASVNVTLTDGTTNTFKSGAGKAGIKVEKPTSGTEGTIVINGSTGTLIVVGGKNFGSPTYTGSGAGIGSNGRIISEDNSVIPASGNITINGGIINATGGLSTVYSGAGIGGGGGCGSSTNNASNGGNTTIHGGTITAISGSCSALFVGAGIGGGAGIYGGGAGIILIDGGTVNAISGNGEYVGAGIGIGASNSSGYSYVGTSLTITGTAVVNTSVPANYKQYGGVIGYIDQITIGGTAVVEASLGTTTDLKQAAAIRGSTLTITGTPKITVLSANKQGDKNGSSVDIIPIKADTITSSIPIMSGIFTGPLSTTTSTDVTISGGSPSNTQIISLPANYASFATTVDNTGAYTAKLGTYVLQVGGTSTFNLSNTLQTYNITGTNEWGLVLAYTNAPDSGTFVSLLNANALGLTLTNYTGLDATGKTEVGAALLAVDTFADKAAVQTAVTNAIATAKTASDAKIAEAALVLEYTDAANAGTFVSLLNANALGLTLTNYAGLDATGKTEVGAALLSVDTFADKAAVQTAVTTAIVAAKTAYDARIADGATITNVKALIGGTTYTWNQAAATNETDVKTKIETIISGLALNGVATTVTKVFYTPAVAGNTGTPAGMNGTYTFTVGLSKGEVTDTTITLTMTITATAYPVTMEDTTNSSGSGSSSGSESSGSNETQSNKHVEILVNDTVVDAGIKVNTVVEDKTITTVSLDEKIVNEKIATEGKNTVITIPITNTSSDLLIGELNGQMIKNLEKQQAIIELTTDGATYTLPASQIDIDAVSKQLGKNIELKDIIVNIEIAKTSDGTAKLVENVANKGKFTVIASPVEFNVRCTCDNKTIDVSKFNNYVERTMAIPAGISKNKITTGVVVDADGTVRHVPTKIIIINGVYYAKINSLTNSTYAVIWNPITYKDVVNHPSKKAIIDLGSRMVISGAKNNLFRPDDYITRAEFVAMLVTSLGLTQGTKDTVYTDVKLKSWYCKYIEAANEYGIISGDAKDKFRPNDKITTEEAMTMLTKAMKITGLKVTFKKGEAKKIVAALAKSGQSEVWADNSIAVCIKVGIVSVKSKQKIAPKDKITRAKAAVMIQNLLLKSNLI